MNSQYLQLATAIRFSAIGYWPLAIFFTPAQLMNASGPPSKYPTWRRISFPDGSSNT
jgi:hypothetical protein